MICVKPSAASACGVSCTDDMRQTIRGLGLRRMHQVVERQDTPSVRGMIHKVRHLVEVVE